MNFTDSRIRKHSSLCVIAFVLVSFASLTGNCALAASATVRVGYPQPSGAMLPLWLVSEAKLDQKYGVPVQNIFISGAARMNQSMVAGDIDLASIGGAVVNTVLAGGDLVAIAVGVPTYGFSLYARPDVKDRPRCYHLSQVRCSFPSFISARSIRN